MSIVRNGGIIGPINTPTSSVASGVWDMARVVSYIGDGNWPAPVSGIDNISVLSLSGGGGGGYDSKNNQGSGGGGAGGILFASSLFLEGNTAFTVTVGAGGAAPGSAGRGSSGSSSQLSYFPSLTSTGGGGGGEGDYNVAGNGDGLSGGSGGGGGNGNGQPGGLGGSGITGQGNAGGEGVVTSGSGAGGGGGYSSAGAAGNVNFGGDGGSGYDLSTFIGGSTSWVAGGGGGGAKTKPGGLGGSGVGGEGGDNATSATAAVASTGSGGGGAANTGGGGNGSGGKVVIKYPGSAQAIGGTVSSATISGTPYTIHTFNSTSTFTPYFTIKLKDTAVYVTNTFTLPTTILTGDIVIVSEISDNGNIMVPPYAPTGFTSINYSDSNPGLANYYKIADNTTAGSSVNAITDVAGKFGTVRVFVFSPPRVGATINSVGVATDFNAMPNMTIPLATSGYNAPFILFASFGNRYIEPLASLSTTNYSFSTFSDIDVSGNGASHVRGVYVVQGGEAVVNTTVSQTGFSSPNNRSTESSFYLYFS